jgi:MFS family permease
MNRSIMAGVNSINAYLGYFNLNELGGTTGIVFAMFSIAPLVGCWFAGPFSSSAKLIEGPASDRWGRRAGMAIGSAIIIAGTSVQASAINVGMFMAGRFFVGFGVCIIATAAPAYVVEMAHPAWRGAFTGGYNICMSYGRSY